MIISRDYITNQFHLSIIIEFFSSFPSSRHVFLFSFLFLSFAFFFPSLAWGNFYLFFLIKREWERRRKKESVNRTSRLHNIETVSNNDPHVFTFLFVPSLLLSSSFSSLSLYSFFSSSSFFIANFFEWRKREKKLKGREERERKR